MWGNISHTSKFGVETIHLFPRIVPDRMVLEEISFQTMIDGVFPNMTGDKRKGWPKFLLNLGSMVIQNSNHVGFLGKRITTLNLVNSPKRMHDPKSLLSNQFT